MPQPIWQCGSYRVNLIKRPLIMGILNVTPDSFSDGGLFANSEQAVDHALLMEHTGADIIDIGGESTRPNASPVPAEEELRRVLPVIKMLSRKVKIPLSIDTTKAEVARLAIDHGVSIINDISGLTRDPDMRAIAAKSKVGLILMHAKGTPETMQRSPRYKNVVCEVYRFLEGQIRHAMEGGISKIRLVVDPGIGFGKTANHNLALINHLADFLPLGVPILIGPSRKSFIGRVLTDETKSGRSPSPPCRPLKERDHLASLTFFRWEGTAAAVAISILRGARIIRVHDVAPMMRVARVADAICKGRIYSA
ncbi:MAG: dihydropteroate synthase [Nitrospirae bacterium]|nr:dihydropteroate synthase [Candidatus Troglogloeales bacterium]